MRWVWVLGLLLFGGHALAGTGSLDGPADGDVCVSAGGDVCIPAGGDVCAPAGQRPAFPQAGTPALLADPSPRGLTLAEAIALAFQRNGDLQVRRSEVEAARGRARQMTALSNPEVATELFTLQEQILGLQQPIRWPVQTRALRRLGELNTEEAVINYRLKRQELVRDVRLQFIEALALRDRVAVLAESLRMAQEVQATAEARLRQGFGSLEEVTRAAIEVGRIRTQWEIMQGALTVRLAELRRLIGADGDIDVAGSLAAVASELGGFSGDPVAIEAHPWVAQGRVQEALWEAQALSLIHI